MKSDPSVEEIITVTLNCILIRMTEINIIDISVIYQEFKESIINSAETVLEKLQSKEVADKFIQK